jgi:hypothetical protein
MAVAAIPAGFDRVKTINRTENGVELVAASGKRARCPLDVAFLDSSLGAA